MLDGGVISVTIVFPLHSKIFEQKYYYDNPYL